MLVDGRPRDASFQRKTGYVQQQDLHLETSTVREALNFSALLRQPAHIPRAEKLAYVDDVIKLLDMEGMYYQLSQDHGSWRSLESAVDTLLDFCR